MHFCQKESPQVNEIQKVFLIIFCVQASAVIWLTVLTKSHDCKICSEQLVVDTK